MTHRQLLIVEVLLLVIVLIQYNCDDRQEGTWTKTITKSGDSEEAVLADLTNYWQRIETHAANEGLNATHSIVSIEQIGNKKYKITYTVTQTKL